MTCIVGLIHDSRVFIGGDSASVDGLYLTVRRDRKVFRKGPFVMGFTTSWRMGQLLRWKFSPPDHPENLDEEAYMATRFVDAVRECFKTGGWAEKDKDRERGGAFLVGYRRRLFIVDSDYQIGVPIEDFDAVGSGAEVAKGALYAPKACAPRRRILLALAAAERFNAGVRRPFVIVAGAET